MCLADNGGYHSFLLTDTLKVNIWELGPGPDGTTEFAFETINKTTGKPSLGGGVAYIKAAVKSKL